jgi:predicted phosphodiesterase
MRLAVLSDLHGNLMALEAVLADIEANGALDAYWVLGDLAVFYPWPVETLDRLRGLPDVDFLQGNTDRYLVTGQRPVAPVRSQEDWTQMPVLLAGRDASFRWTVERLSYSDYLFLRDLPKRLEMTVPGYGRVVAFHANPKDDEGTIFPDASEERIRSYLEGVDARLVLYGHTHRPVNRVVDGVRLVNDGSVGLPLDGDPRPAYALLDFEEGECAVSFRRVDYDREEVIAELERVEHPSREWATRLIREAKVK